MDIIEFKNVEEKDYSKLTALIEKLADESNFYPFTSDDYKVSDDSQRIFIQRLNNEKNSYISGAYFKYEMVGVVYLYGGNRIRNYHSTTLGIGVLKSYENIGIGKKLMQDAIDYAYKSDVIGKINVQVIKENIRAISFYKKNGFEVEGVEKRSLFIDGLFYDAINMGLIIQ
ncbi:acetyltransferase, GNAT family [Peptostreptococcaceae bacterium AS15]|nr:acetyltransferase, GNAT family [Peptostreptococcaceae bacterium AS15]